MIYTVVSNTQGKQLWEGASVFLLKGTRVNHDGISYKVVDSAVGLYGSNPNDDDYGIRQSTVVEKTRD